MIVSPEELNKLITTGLVKNDNGYKFCVKDICIPVEVDVGEKQQKTFRVEASDVDRVLRAFPSIAEVNKALQSKGVTFTRNLRTGRKDIITKHLKSLASRYSPDMIIEIVKFEAERRIKATTARHNEIAYMKACEAWLNDDANIDAMDELMTTEPNKKKDIPIDDNFKF